jgi:hypothetical protein
MFFSTFAEFFWKDYLRIVTKQILSFKKTQERNLLITK